MTCPRCGRPIQQGASFCMHCGQQLAVGRPVERPSGYQQPAYSGVPAAVPVPIRTNKWLWPTVGVLALLLAALIGVVAHLVSAAKPSGPHLVAQGSAGPVPLAVGKPTMPKDIYDWLDHLRQTEDRKNALEL